MIERERGASEVYRTIRDIIRNENRLIPGEVEGIIKMVYGDCNNHLVMESIRYAEKELMTNSEHIFRLVELNPGTDENFWKERHGSYKDSISVLETLRTYFDMRSLQPEVKADPVIRNLSIPKAEEIKVKELKAKESRITQKQIALMYWYLHECGEVDNINWDQVAADYGYTNPTSGKSIYDEYNYFEFVSNRVIYPSAVRNLRAVIKMLVNYPEALQLAENDLVKAKARRPEVKEKLIK